MITHILVSTVCSHVNARARAHLSTRVAAAARHGLWQLAELSRCARCARRHGSSTAVQGASEGADSLYQAAQYDRERWRSGSRSERCRRARDRRVARPCDRPHRMPRQRGAGAGLRFGLCDRERHQRAARVVLPAVDALQVPRWLLPHRHPGGARRGGRSECVDARGRDRWRRSAARKYLRAGSPGRAIDRGGFGFHDAASWRRADTRPAWAWR